MRRSSWVLAVLVGVATIALTLRYREQTTTVPANTGRSTAQSSLKATPSNPQVASANVPIPSPTPIVAASIAPNALSLEPTGHEAAALRGGAHDTNLLGVKMALRDYRAALGENPVGTNSEIAAALFGHNARGANFTSDGLQRDGDGNLLDRWAHPYFFHQLSRTEMEIRSAGPDGVMWTADDELMR